MSSDSDNNDLERFSRSESIDESSASDIDVVQPPIDPNADYDQAHDEYMEYMKGSDHNLHTLVSDEGGKLAGLTSRRSTQPLIEDANVSHLTRSEFKVLYLSLVGYTDGPMVQGLVSRKTIKLLVKKIHKVDLCVMEQWKRVITHPEFEQRSVTRPIISSMGAEVNTVYRILLESMYNLVNYLITVCKGMVAHEDGGRDVGVNGDGDVSSKLQVLYRSFSEADHKCKKALRMLEYVVTTKRTHLKTPVHEYVPMPTYVPVLDIPVRRRDKQCTSWQDLFPEALSTYFCCPSRLQMRSRGAWVPFQQYGIMDFYDGPLLDIAYQVKDAKETAEAQNVPWVDPYYYPHPNRNDITLDVDREVAEGEASRLYNLANRRSQRSSYTYHPSQSRRTSEESFKQSVPIPPELPANLTQTSNLSTI